MDYLHVFQSETKGKNFVSHLNLLPLFARIMILLFFIPFGSVFANIATISEVTITLNVADKPVSDILSEIEKQSGYNFFYNNNEIDVHRTVTVKASNKSLKDVLDIVFKGTNIKYSFLDNSIILSNKTIASSGETKLEGRLINGIITDVNNEPLIGVNIAVKGTNKGSISDENGKFSFNVPANAVLTFSYIGYKQQEVAVGNKSLLNVVLSDDQRILDEVFVIGYGSVKKQNLTGSVSKVTSESLQARPLPNVAEAFQGQLSGVRAQSTTGIPGSEARIRIRGNNTINGNSSPLYIIDGVPCDDMSSLNPNDVASINVLKDASTTSIYGSRGGNGVILIETKQGQGKPSVTFDSYYGLQTPDKLLPIMDRDEWILFNTWRRNAEYIRSGGLMTDDQSKRTAALKIPTTWASTTTNTDWQDAVTQTAPIQSYQVSASAKSDMGSLFFSGGYMSQDGVIVNTYYNRMNFRLNGSLNINKNIRVGVNVAPTISDQDKRLSESKEACFHHAITISPLVGLDEATQDKGFPTDVGYVCINPLLRLKQVKDQTRTNAILTNVWGEADLMKGLTFKTLYGNNYTNAAYEYFRPGNLNSGVSAGSSNVRATSRWSIQNTLTYSKIFGDHDVNFLLGQSADRTTEYYINAVATGWPAENIETLNVATTATTASTTWSNYSTASFFGRASYAFKDRYLFSASARYDGSSRFGSNNKWGLFPSLSGGWKINDESFMENMDWLSLLKVRASWGKAGNDRIGNYDYMSLLGTTYKTSWGNAIVAGTAPNNIANENLCWEATTSTDLGLDLSVFNNRIQFSFDYYKNVTDNLLFDVPIPYATGFNSYRDNVGSMQNIGWEIDLTSHNLTGDFKWSTSLNLSANQNKVLDMGEITSFTSTSFDGIFITKVGGPVSQYQCYRTNGLLLENDFDENGKALVPIATGQEMGNVQYVDQLTLQPDGTMAYDGKITAADQVPYGNNLPDLMYGLTNTFSWKGLDLNILLQGQVGGDIMFLGARTIDNAAGNINGFARWIHCWKPEYAAGNNPVPEGADMSWDGHTPNPFGVNNVNSDLRVYDATFLKIKNVTLAYSIPRRILDRARIKALRVYLSVDNLMTFDNYPGMTVEGDSYGNGTTRLGVDYATYPLSKKYTLGLSLTF